MKKILAIALALVTMLSTFAMTVSAAATDEMIGPEEAMEIISERLGYEPPYSIVEYDNSVVLEIQANHRTKRYWRIRVEGDEWGISNEDFFNELNKFEEWGFFIVPLINGTAYADASENTNYIIYGETMDCEVLPIRDGEKVVEIFSDVQSEEFLSITEVAELFYEEFDHDVRVTKCGKYFDAFLVEDLHADKEFLIPVKEEGLPIEVWEEFVIEFEDEFDYDYSYLNALGVKMYFYELLGYRPEVSIFRWGEDDVTIDVKFGHLGGKTFCIEAVYSKSLEEWCVTDVALEAFLDRHPECSVVPNFTWEQLLRLLDFYHNW